MSADKYAQFIAEQQRKLSVSGVNAVNLQEKKHMTKADIAGLKEPKDKIDADDLEALRNKEHLKKEEVEQIDELTGKGKLAGMKKHYDTQAKKYGEYKDSDLEYEDPEDYQDKMMQHAAHKDASKRAGAMMKLAAAKKKGKPSEVSKAKAQFKKTSADKQYIVREPFKEEVEQVDEVRAIQGKHASVAHKAPSITPSKVKYKGKASKPKVQTDLNIMASYEIPDEELKMIEEATQKGELSKIIDHYKNHEKLHKGLADKHAKLATDMHDMGDEDSFEHHYSKSHIHNDEAQRARYKIDHAVALSAKVKARKQMKDAQDAVNKAGRAKREWDY